MMSNNIVHILENFKVNTDAQATNQGFFYQYLVTLDVWLENYNEENDVTIYCETEDDIKVEDLQKKKVEFTQIKAYAKNFNIKSEEIQKSIINFFQLYVEYKDNSPTFTFHTTSDFEGDFFDNIQVEPKLKQDYKDESIKAIEKVLIDNFDKKNNIQIKKLEDGKASLEKKLNTLKQEKARDKRKEEIDKIVKERKSLSDKLEELKEFIKKEAPNFIDRIKWRPEKKDKEDSINNFIDSIEIKISKIEGFKEDTSTAYAHLIKKVLIASQAKNIDDRRLDRKMIDDLIEEAKDIDKFKQNLQIAELLSKFRAISQYHKIQIKALDIISNQTEDILKELSPIQDIQQILENKYKEFENIPLLLDTEKSKPINEFIINLEYEKEVNKEIRLLVKLKKFRWSKSSKLLTLRDFNYQWIECCKNNIIQIDKMLQENLNKISKILIHGEAGIGKTSLCKYISYQWREKKFLLFKYVIYIPLRSWESKGLEGAIKDYYFYEDESRSFELFKGIEKKSKEVLFLFDGYDELNEKKKSELQRYLKKLENYIIVSRPSGYDKNDFKELIFYKTVGLQKEDKNIYIDSFFNNSDKNNQDGLKQFLQERSTIDSLSYIPLMLQIICSLWKEKRLELNVTKVELYTDVIETLLKHSDKEKTLNSCLRKNKIKKSIGKLAFHGLKTQTILFDCDYLAQRVKDKDIDFFENSVMKSGILSSSNPPIEFVHLSFQEYFTAYYVSKLKKKKMRKIIQKYKFYPNMQVFFSFLGGLIEDKEFLLREIENKPVDLIGIYSFKVNTLCLQEIKEEKLSNERRELIFNDFFSNLKIMSKLYIERNGLGLSSISHLIDDDFMSILIEKSRHEKIEVDGIAKELLEKDSLKFVPLFFKYVGNKKVDIKFRESLLFALSMNPKLLNIHKQEDVIHAFLNEDDNSKIQKYLLSILIKMGRENSNKSRTNSLIISSFIEKFEIIKLNNEARNFLAINSKNNKELEFLFLSSIRKNISNKQYIAKLMNVYIEMNNDDNSEIIRLLISFLKNDKDSEFKAYCAIKLLEIEENIDSIFELLIELIYDENINMYNRVKIVSYLMFKGLNEDKVKEFFLSSLHSEEVKKQFNMIYRRVLIISQSNNIRYIIDFQSLVYRDKEELTNIFIYIVSNSNLGNNIKKDIVKFLFNSPHTIDKKLIDTFFEIIKNEKIHNIPRGYITNLLISLAQYEPSILDTFSELVHDDKLKIYIAEYIGWCQSISMKYINILETLLRDITLEEKYRKKIFNVLLSSLTNHSISNENKTYIEKLLSSLKDSDDMVLKSLFLEEERNKEKEFQRQEAYVLATRENHKIENKALVYVGGKPIYPPKFNTNEVVTKEAILIKLEEAKEYSPFDMSRHMKTFVKDFLNSIVEEHQSILLEMIDDESITLFDKRDILIILSQFIGRDVVLKENFIRLYDFYKDTNIRKAIIEAFMSINEIDFFIEILGKNEYDSFTLGTIIHYLLSFNQNDIEDKLIDLSIQNEDFFRDFKMYMNFNLLFKAYDKNMIVVEEIVKKVCQKGVPLYVSKDNKLCTIESGEEVKNKREITDEVLSKLIRDISEELGLLK